MRTTVTLEPDVARRLREVVRQEKLSFKQALNVTLRRGLDQTLVKPKSKPFHTVAEDMGVLPHLNYDNIGDLLELAERTPPK
jgi:hypothetical protein